MSINSSNPKTVSISEFKAKCLAMIDEVNKTRQPLRITRRGEVVAEMVPPANPRELRERMFGSLVGTATIIGDIVGPTGDLNDWEAWRD